MHFVNIQYLTHFLTHTDVAVIISCPQYLSPTLSKLYKPIQNAHDFKKSGVMLDKFRSNGIWAKTSAGSFRESPLKGSCQTYFGVLFIPFSLSLLGMSMLQF